MFSGLANYLFGSTNSDNNDTNNISKKENENNFYCDDQINKPIDDNFKFSSIEADDDDWLIVDKEEEESLPQTDSEEELPFVEIKNNNSKSPRSRIYQRNQNRAGNGHNNTVSVYLNSNNNHLIQQQQRHNDQTSQPLYVAQSTALSINPNLVGIVHHMEESWFLTPPPCFTSTEPINMETSPFENLLIEHPSMSVYHSIRSAQESGESYDLEIEDSQLRPTANRSAVRIIPIIQRNINRMEHLTKQQFKENMLLHNSQKIKEKNERQNNCARAIKRGNKVREFNSKGRCQRRSDQQHCKVISGANNNRKC